METEREAVVLAVPFAAGVAVATFLLQTFYIRNHSSVALVLLSFAATVSSAVLIFRSCRGRFRKLPLPAARIFVGLMFLSAGITVCLMDSLTFPDTGKHSPVSSFAYGCREALSRIQKRSTGHWSAHSSRETAADWTAIQEKYSGTAERHTFWHCPECILESYICFSHVCLQYWATHLP